MTHRHSTGEARTRVNAMLDEAMEHARLTGDGLVYQRAAMRIYTLHRADAQSTKEAPE